MPRCCLIKKNENGIGMEEGGSGNVSNQIQRVTVSHRVFLREGLETSHLRPHLAVSHPVGVPGLPVLASCIKGAVSTQYGLFLNNLLNKHKTSTQKLPTKPCTKAAHKRVHKSVHHSRREKCLKR